jgi:hypothetical protein
MRRVEVKGKQRRTYVFMSRHQNAGQKHSSQTVSKSPQKSDEIKIFRNDSNRSELGSDILNLEPNVMDVNDVMYWGDFIVELVSAVELFL